MNKLEISKKLIMVQRCFCECFATFCLVFLSSCQTQMQQNQLLSAEDQLWQNPSECLTSLDSIEYDKLTRKEQLRWQLCYEHAFFRCHHVCHNDSILKQLAFDFTQGKDYAHAGEAYYVLGSTYCTSNQPHLATYYLKQAEHNLLLGKTPNDNLLGITYFRLGSAATRERLFHVANDYFQKSIPYLRHTDNTLYIACAYRDYALSMNNDQRDSALLLMDSALYYIQKTSNIAIRSEIECLSIQIHHSDSISPEIITKYHYLCDTLGISTYAANLARYYLDELLLDSAKLYLSILETDTANNIWTKEHYLSLSSQYQSAMGHPDSALAILAYLHEWQTQEIENTSFVRTYTIAQQLDVAHANEENLRLQLRQQQMYLIITVLILFVLLLCVVGIFIRLRQQEIETKNAVLAAQNEEKRAALLTQLNHVLSNATAKNKKEYLHGQCLDNQQLEQLRIDFDLCYDNLLSRLQSQHPLLTSNDIDVIICIILNYNTEDCCILLSYNSKNTLWQRRKRIKQHLGLEANIDLDTYLRGLV